MQSRFDTRDLMALMDDDTDHRIVDVRTGSEFENGHIPGSYNIPLDTLGEHREGLSRHVHEPVILICQSGNRASQAEEKLAAAGMSNIHVLEGGMNDWIAKGGDVRRVRERWSLERQVRLVAGLIVFTSVVAGLFWTPAIFVAAFVGAGLSIAALTNTCAMGMLLARLPYNQASSCDVDTAVAQLTGAAR